MSDELRRAVDRVTFWRNKVDRRFHKNAKKLATFNLWAAEDTAQHIAEALRQGEVTDYDGSPFIDFPLPIWSGDTLHTDCDDD